MNVVINKVGYIGVVVAFFLLFSYGKVYAQQNDFKIKGFHLDLRIQVMTMPALKDFALKLSQNGVNTLVMEWEATYPYEKHAVISNRYAYSRDEVTSFIVYCNQIGIDVIPLQQSFGHVEYILRHYKYKDLREDPKDYSQVNPLKEEACKALFTDLYKDMLSTHTSRYIHIGGDETYLLGHSQESKQKVAAVGKGRLYGDYIKMLCEIVIGLGKKPIVWADIALNYPDALVDLPKETIFVDWNYGWDLDRFGDHKKLTQSGFEIWGAPAIRSHPDNYFLTDWEKHFNNIRDFIPQARNLGYEGIVMTSWSTSGIYSAVFESSSDIVDLHAVRRVYPITGFNMLMQAYFQAIQLTEAIDVDDFIKEYTNARYGLNQQESDLFWEALKLVNHEINQGDVLVSSTITPQQLLDNANRSLEILMGIKPTNNQEEFEHYRLMGIIRRQYLQYMLIEIRTNSSSFTTSEIPETLRQLKALDTKKIDKKFYALNKKIFYKAELELENKLRNYKIKALIKRLESDKINE